MGLTEIPLKASIGKGALKIKCYFFGGFLPPAFFFIFGITYLLSHSQIGLALVHSASAL